MCAIVFNSIFQIICERYLKNNQYNFLMNIIKDIENNIFLLQYKIL